MNLFELSLRLNKFPIGKAREELRRVQSIPEERFEQHVKESCWNIFQYHKQNNPCYSSIATDENYGSWDHVPVMTKADLQRPLGERFSEGFTKKNVYVNKTSGSSGHPFIFAKDRFCHALTWAEIMDRYRWFGLDFHKSRQARFYGIPLDKWGYWKERFKDYMSNRYRFPIFDLSDDVLWKYYKKFKKRKFDYIYGYTSALYQFSLIFLEIDQRLVDICPTLKYCITTSEMLFEEDKEIMTDMFGVPVINEYGASELDLIAFTNPDGEFQLNSETLFVEVVDENGKSLPDGAEGRIVITSLYNKAHPMIRYDIGDSGTIERVGRWKRPVLRKLLGRTNDVAILPDGKKVPGLTFYYVTKSIIEDGGKVREFIVEQNSLERFVIRYTSYDPLTESEVGRIKSALDKYVGSGLDLEFIREEKIKRTAAGKLKQFSSKIIDK